MRYDPDHKARTRDKVLAEAAAAIRAHGPDKLGVAAVMARAGLTHGGFYAHFGSRDELLAAAVDHMFTDRHAALYTDFDGVDPRATLGRFVDAYLSPRHCAARDTGCPIPVLAGDLHRLPAAARARFAVAVDRMTGGIARLLDRAGVAEPRATARSAIAEAVGAVALARALPPAEADDVLTSARASLRGKFGLALSPP